MLTRRTVPFLIASLIVEAAVALAQAAPRAVLFAPSRAETGSTVMLSTTGSVSDKPVQLSIEDAPAGVEVAITPFGTPGPDGKYIPMGGFLGVPRAGHYRIAAVAFGGDKVAVAGRDVQVYDPPDVQPQPAPQPVPQPQPPPFNPQPGPAPIPAPQPQPAPQPVPQPIPPPQPTPPAPGAFGIAVPLYQMATEQRIDPAAVRAMATILESAAAGVRDFVRPGNDDLQTPINATWRTLQGGPFSAVYAPLVQLLGQRVKELSGANEFLDGEGFGDATRLGLMLAEAASGLRAYAGGGSR